jgi:predicted enzyme related to lactoylglutathione lyase
MKIRLQEIELATKNTTISKDFYNSILGLDTVVDKENLNVFNSGIAGMDFNTSTHLPAKVTVTSFLTDDLQTIIDALSPKKFLLTGLKSLICASENFKVYNNSIQILL